MNNIVCFGKEIRWKSSNVEYSVKLIHKLGYNLVPCDQEKRPMIPSWLPYTEERLQRVILEEWLSKKWRDVPLWYVITGPTPYSDGVPLVAIDGDNRQACKKIEELCPPTPLLTKSRKGIHYYYRYPEFEVRSRQKTEIVGDGHYDIDIRAWHGLIGCPGGNRYLWSEPWSRELLENLPIYNPEWLPVGEKTKPEKRNEPVEIVASLDDRATQFQDYLKAAGGCQVGSTKSCGNKAFRLAMVGVHGMGVARDVAIELMSEWGQQPDQVDDSGSWYPWTLNEITHKIDSALSTEYQGVEGDKLDPTFKAEEKVHQIVKPFDPVMVEELSVQYDDPMELGEAPEPKKVQPLAWLNKQTAFQLDKEQIEITYVVDKLLACMPTIIGGRFKALKTLITTDLVVSMSSGSKFLNEWGCKKMRVGVWSGESGKAALQNAQRRICRAKGISTADCDLDWHYALPPLYDGEILEQLAETITTEKYGAVFIDPLYLCLLDAKSASMAGNVFMMGQALRPIAEIGQRTKCLIGLVHHFGKWTASNQDFSPAELGELSQAGMAEWARQWLLLSRRSKYDHDGKHQLYLTAGGSLGQAYQLAIDVDEGPMDSDGYFRTKWEIDVKTMGNAKTDDTADKKRAKVDDMKRRVKDALLAEGECHKTRVATILGVSPSTHHLTWAIDELISEKQIQTRIGTTAQNKSVQMLSL